MNNFQFVKFKSLLRVLFILVTFQLFQFSVFGQKFSYFADGYHGGIYGHYPMWQTRFMVEKLQQNEFWKVNLEIEPETWDTVKLKNPDGYELLKSATESPFYSNRIEIVNPSYAQPYCFNISGESLIRQFYYGIRKTHEHFPSLKFLTYSAEEPCFTSCLPQILLSFGFKNAVLKNPDTGWGGYTRGFNAELVNWIGPDGTSIITSPRYASEFLKPNSTWQTMAWNNSAEYIDSCYKYGIKSPVGMCYQDAGWRNGPWLGDNTKAECPFEYILWSKYFESRTDENTIPNWKFSQEDIQVSLVWGAQVLQRLAQRVRVSENKIIQAEKMAALSSLYNSKQWPQSEFDNAWRTLMLAQHHDCWIVPYNGKKCDTWADKVKIWTDCTNAICDSIINSSFFGLGVNGFTIKVFNSLSEARTELVRVEVPSELINSAFSVYDESNKAVLSQIQINAETGKNEILFLAKVPSLGFSYFTIKNEQKVLKSSTFAKTMPDGSVVIESDVYKLVIDGQKGGAITSLVCKSDNYNLIDSTAQPEFNSLSGNFYARGRFYSSTSNAAKISIVENGPLRATVRVVGSIAGQEIVQEISLVQGQKLIYCKLLIDWKDSPGIGAYSQYNNYKAEEAAKAFYNDKYKLLLKFPVQLKSTKIYKDAPFDVCESQLDNTFFNSWDSIKNNIILHWVDSYDSFQNRGISLFTDHTTSYTHGADFPLGLTVQYSGMGLWGRDYTIDGPTNIHYALFLHAGKWDKAGVQSVNNAWNEPLIASVENKMEAEGGKNKSFINIMPNGIEVSSMRIDGDDLVLHLYNTGSNNNNYSIALACNAEKIEMEELNGKLISVLKITKPNDGVSNFEINIPKFGIRTVRIINAKLK